MATNIPGYRILRELGEGGMATVYLAEQERLGRQVALKVLHPAATFGSDFSARFIKEGQIIARLQHPQIVTIYDLDVTDGIMYFSMEYLPNGTLGQLIAQGIPPARAISITLGVAEALSFAHSQGVIHRDIKPQNILFRTDGTPVLTDFGIARAITQDLEATQLTSAGMVVGSPRYMSPEQCMSKPIDARSDLYSLGVVFYQMLAQELPFQGSDVVTLAMAHCSAPIPTLGRTLRAYQPVLERLLAKAPEDRYPNADALIEDLRSLEADTAPTKTIPKLEQGSSKRSKTGPRGSRRGKSRRPETGTSKSRPPSAPAPAKPADEQGPWTTGRLTLVTGLAALSLIAAVAAYRTLVEKEDLPPAPVIEPTRPQAAVDAEKEALALLEQDKIDQALDRVSAGLVAVSGDAGLEALKGRLLNERYARTILSGADAQVARSDLGGALKTIDRGLERLPDHPGLTKRRDQIQARLTEQRRTRVAELLKAGETALARGDLAEASRMAADGLELIPNDTDLQALKKRIAHARSRAETRKELINQAKQLHAEGLLSESLEIVNQGLGLNPADAELLALKAALDPTTQESRSAGEEALSAVDRALKTLKEANIAFNAPTALRLHETATIHLMLDATKDAEELQSMLAEAMLAEEQLMPAMEGELDSATVRISEKMEARLTGRNFEITAITSEIQAVSRLEPTEWKWEVAPIKSGEQHLHLTLSALINPGDGVTPRVIRTFDKIVKVKVRWHKKVVAFAEENWQWLWATLLVPAAGWIWKKRNQSKMR